MSKKTRTLNLPSALRAQLKTMPLNTSAAICQAVLNAREDDGLLVKALKRRLALPPTKNETYERTTISQDARIDSYLTDLTERSQLTIEEIIRLAIEAYIFKL